MPAYHFIMEPAAGEGRLLFAGETLRARLRVEAAALPGDARAFLRTDLNSAAEKRLEMVEHVEKGLPRFGAGWRDVPMRLTGPGVFEADLIAFQPGYYELKAHLDFSGNILWPQGPNASVSVHPLKWRGGNTVYCAFPRQFGPFRGLESAGEAASPPAAIELERQGFTVIPPSGTLADLARELPFLFQELGVRILHLLPVQETPTHYGRMGRYGSPYAAADLRSVNHAYCVFRRDRTPDEQFREFCARVHAYGGEVLLDLAGNHLGWSTDLLNEHPDWFVRRPDGHFVSPGAWGVTWEDLIELDFGQKAVWRYLADALLLWCERGADGFRCDAGHMIPLEVWEYVTARVHRVFSDTLFLFEGLGGDWNRTESALRRGGMQWAYSEMFQQHGVEMVRGYFGHLDHVGREMGVLANYAETHDNPRLAAGGEAYVRMRLTLCALSSNAGAFGFTNGVEWLASEKVDVHGSSGLRWGRSPNAVAWIRRINDLLRQHPLFRGVARLTPLDDLPPDVIGFRREREGEALLVLINLHATETPSAFRLPEGSDLPAGPCRCLLGGRELDLRQPVSLGPFEVLCFDLKWPREHRTVEALADAVRRDEEELRLRGILGALWGHSFDLEGFAALMDAVRERGLKALLAAAALGPPLHAGALAESVRAVTPGDLFLSVSEWSSALGDRLHVLSTDQFLYLEEKVPFRVRLVFPLESMELNTFEDFGNSRFVAFSRVPEGPFTLEQSRLDRPAVSGSGEPQWLAGYGHALALDARARPVSLAFDRADIEPSHHFLLANGLGSYTLLPLLPGLVHSKYDALLAANLHPRAPDERVVLLKRLRAWLVTPMTSHPLSPEYLVEFRRWPHPTWFFQFRLPEGLLRIEQTIELVPGENRGRVVFSWNGPAAEGLTLILRPDVECRGHHGETKAHRLDEADFAQRYEMLPQGPASGRPAAGFRRALGENLEMVVSMSRGEFRPESEWLYQIAHPHEATRGQESLGDAFSPGFFRVALGARRGSAGLEFAVGPSARGRAQRTERRTVRLPRPRGVPDILREAARQFLVRRDGGRSLLAGYPWFLDWGRDTLIAARGLLAEGLVEEVAALFFTFAAREANGSLPNALAAENDANRETSDAPLWLLRLGEELADAVGWSDLLRRARGRNVDLAGVIRSICDHYRHGTPNGIGCDAATGLVYSPPHFTWMDTQWPAATPREGYPIEIQALWVRGLEFAARVLDRPEYAGIAQSARAAVLALFWLPDAGYFADVLPARRGLPASSAGRDESLRPNQLLAVALGLAGPEQARRSVIQTGRHLVVPAGLRSVANLSIPSWPWLEGDVPPPGFDPQRPYRGRYEGDEDTARKLAYHNGSVWTQLLPLWIEALLAAFPGDPRALRLGRAMLRTYEAELRRGCIGQISEILDGDYPHQARGCCAQAWSVTEVLRMGKLLDPSPRARLKVSR